MLPLVFTALGLGPPPAWEFRDELARDGRPMAAFRTVELGDTPPRPLHADDRPPAGSSSATCGSGPAG